MVAAEEISMDAAIALDISERDFYTWKEEQRKALKALVDGLDVFVQLCAGFRVGFTIWIHW